MSEKKQMMDMCAVKRFTTNESNEHRRNWSEQRWKVALEEGNYDRSREHMNFEIVKGGKVQPIDKSKTIPKMIKARLDELGLKGPNEGLLTPKYRTVANFVFGGNRERMLELAFGSQDYDTVCRTKDHSHLKRMPEIEEWAKDIYDWCSRKWGEDNIMSFVVHLDETSPHLHCVILPITPDNKLSFRKVFVGENNDRRDFRANMLELHTSLAKEVNEKWGLMRGDDRFVTGAKHRSTEEYRRDLSRECSLLENQKSALEESIKTGREELAAARTKVRSLTTMVENRQRELQTACDELQRVDDALKRGEGDVAQFLEEKRKLEARIALIRDNLADKQAKLKAADAEYERIRKALEDATRQLEKKSADIKLAEEHIRELGRQTQASSRVLRQNYNSLVKAALFDNVIDEFRNKMPMLDNGKDLFDDTFLQDFADDGKNVITCTLLLMIDMVDKATDFAQTHGGGGSTSELPWRGRDKDEDDMAWARRCAMQARAMLKPASGAKRKR